jgi:hypothetical protein
VAKFHPKALEAFNPSWKRTHCSFAPLIYHPQNLGSHWRTVCHHGGERIVGNEWWIPGSWRTGQDKLPVGEASQDEQQSCLQTPPSGIHSRLEATATFPQNGDCGRLRRCRDPEQVSAALLKIVSLRQYHNFCRWRPISSSRGLGPMYTLFIVCDRAN